MKMPVGVPRSSGFQICDILDLNEQAKTAQPDSETTHSPLQTMLPGSGHPTEFNLVASLAAQQHAAAAGLAAGLYSHTMANHHDPLHAHSQWSRQDPSRHGKFLMTHLFL